MLWDSVPNCSITVTVTGNRVNRGAGYGLEIPVTYSIFGPEKAVEWLKRHVAREVEDVYNKTKRCMK